MKRSVIDEWLAQHFGGVNPKAVGRLALASEVLRAFDKKAVWIRESLAKEIGLDISKELKESNFKQWQNNRRKFYYVMHPLLQTLVQTDKHRKRVFFKINRGMLNAYHTGIEKAFGYRYGKWDEIGLSEALADREIEESEEPAEEEPEEKIEEETDEQES